MNQGNCSLGFATDETFLPPFRNCDVSLVLYDILTSIFLIIRFYSFIIVWKQWIERRRKFTRKSIAKNNIHKREWQNRIPIVPMLNTIVFITWILVFVLVRFNIINYQNGGTFFLWGLSFLLYASYSMLFQRKLVGMGTKIIPGGRRANLFDVNTPAGNVGAKLKSLDGVLKFLILFETSVIIIQSVSAMILGLIFPAYLVFLQISFIFEAIYILASATVLIYQIQRVTLFVTISNLEEKAKAQVLKKFKSQQNSFFLISSSGFLFNILLASQVIPIQWWILIYWIAVETSVSSFAVIELLGAILIRIVNIGGKKRTKEPQSSLAVIETAPSSSKGLLSSANEIQDVPAQKEQQL